MDFPVFATKTPGVTKRFNLSDPADRKEYFQAKVGTEIDKIRRFLKDRQFLAFLIGKKNSGKGTYSKLFMEAMDVDSIGHLAVGDIVRDIHKSLEIPSKEEELLKFLKANYRGFDTVEENIGLINNRSQSTLLSSELILALIKFEVSKRPHQALFIDGFPRAHDQINYSIYLKELIKYSDAPDFFVFLNVPDAIIDERIKYRVVCPICKTPRNLKLLATKEVGYDKESKSFYLICDNPQCPQVNKARMLPKEGDELGIEPIRARLEVDNQIFEKLLTLEGVPKVYLRNSVPVGEADKVDDYELTPAYSYEYDEASDSVKTIEKSWIIKDDLGRDSYSLLPPAVVVGMIKQVAKVLDS